MTRGLTHKLLVERWDGSCRRRVPDEVVVEEPLGIRLDGRTVATTMRTPGHDFELAVGFCLAEGWLRGASVRSVRYCEAAPPLGSAFNEVMVETDGLGPEPVPRLGTTTSSCGLCGSTTIDDLVQRVGRVACGPPLRGQALVAVPDRVRAAQVLFDRTGGLHAAAAFDGDGRPCVVREDIGRHNAVDKVVGRMLLDGALPAGGLGLFVSGRASLELVAKAWAAGFGLLMAVSAPSNLAVDAACRAGITLVGFARGQVLNVYAGRVRE